MTAPEAPPAPAVSVSNKSNTARRPAYRPLERGEIRRAILDTRNAVGLLGLRWASLGKRALFGRRARG
jgi:hypothetical protein